MNQTQEDVYTEEQAIENHFIVFVIVASGNIAIVCALLLSLYNLIKTHQESVRSKYIYKLFFTGWSIDIIANLYSFLRFVKDHSGFVSVTIFQLISLHLTILQILFLLFKVLQVQKLFSVLDHWLERMIRPCQILLISLTTITLIIITVTYIYMSIAVSYMFQYNSDIFVLNTSSFLIYAAISIVIGLYSLYLIKKRLKEYYVFMKKRNKIDSVDQSFKKIKQIQYLINAIVLIALVLVAIILLLFAQKGHEYVEEAIAVAAVFLAILRIMAYFFFEKCKAIALIKPEKTETTNLHDISNQFNKTVRIGGSGFKTHSTYQDKNTVIIETKN